MRTLFLKEKEKTFNFLRPTEGLMELYQEEMERLHDQELL